MPSCEPRRRSHSNPRFTAPRHSLVDGLRAHNEYLSGTLLPKYPCVSRGPSLRESRRRGLTRRLPPTSYPSTSHGFTSMPGPNTPFPPWFLARLRAMGMSPKPLCRCSHPPISHPLQNVHSSPTKSQRASRRHTAILTTWLVDRCGGRPGAGRDSATDGERSSSCWGRWGFDGLSFEPRGVARRNGPRSESLGRGNNKVSEPYLGSMRTGLGTQLGT